MGLPVRFAAPDSQCQGRGRVSRRCRCGFTLQTERPNDWPIVQALGITPASGIEESPSHRFKLTGQKRDSQTVHGHANPEGGFGELGFASPSRVAHLLPILPVKVLPGQQLPKLRFRSAGSAKIASRHGTEEEPSDDNAEQNVDC